MRFAPPSAANHLRGMLDATTTRVRPKLLSRAAWLACSWVGDLLTYCGVPALVSICVFALGEWGGYGRLVLATWGTACAGCIAVGLVLRACATRIARRLAPTSRPG